MITQAIVLAAGLGERLRPLTLNCPKPMLEVNNTPLLVHVLRNLQRAGIKNIVIHVSYLGDYIVKKIGNGTEWDLDLNICYAKSLQPLGTGGGINLSVEYLNQPQQPFLCINSDIYTDYDYSHLLDLQLDGQTSLGHLVLVDNPVENLKGDYDVIIRNNNQQLTRGNLDTKPYTFSGIAAYHPCLVGLSQSGLNQVADLKYSIINDIDANIDKFTASVHHGFWSDVGTIARLNAVQGKISC